MTAAAALPLTRRGWTLLALAALAAVAGWLFGISELLALSASAAALTSGCALWVRSRPLRFDVSRRIVPSRVTAGQSATVTLTVRNRSRRRTTTVDLADDTGAAGEVRLGLGPLGPGQIGTGTYRCEAPQRGVFAVGPLCAEVADPFGLARRSVVTDGSAPLVVHPVATPTVLALSAAGSGRANAAARPLPGRDNDEFNRLRAYQPGDDLRRVHWPSSARVGALLVREDELDRAGHVTVVVDLRRSRWSPTALEAAISAAAGLAERAVAADVPVRVVVTNRSDSGVGTGRRHLTRILDELAAVDHASVHRTRVRPDRAGARRAPGDLAGSGTTVLVVSDDAAAAELRAAVGAGRGGRTLSLVVAQSPAGRHR